MLSHHVKELLVLIAPLGRVDRDCDGDSNDDDCSRGEEKGARLRVVWRCNQQPLKLVEAAEGMVGADLRV